MFCVPLAFCANPSYNLTPRSPPSHLLIQHRIVEAAENDTSSRSHLSVCFELKRRETNEYGASVAWLSPNLPPASKKKKKNALFPRVLSPSVALVSVCVTPCFYLRARRASRPLVRGVLCRLRGASGRPALTPPLPLSLPSPQARCCARSSHRYDIVYFSTLFTVIHFVRIVLTV